MTAVATFLVRDPRAEMYYMADESQEVKDGNIKLDDVIKLAETSNFWIERGKAIEKYAQLEHSLCFLFAYCSDTDKVASSIIFYKIASASSRNSILEKLIQKKFGNKYNLFWNSYLRQLRAIDNKRNEIVHWTTAAFADIKMNKLIVGLHLIPPSSISVEAPHNVWISPDDMRDFGNKCVDYLRLCNIFTSSQKNSLPLLDIFEQPLVYPLPADHPINNYY